MSQPIRFNVLTVSDRCAAGEQEDLGGPAVVDIMLKLFTATCCKTATVPDEKPLITACLQVWLDRQDAPDLILTTGGTGLSPRDVTPEATEHLIERRHDALLELARRRCYDITPMTYLSRGLAGAARQTLIINLPGSPRGAVQMIEAIADVLPHAIQSLRGTVKDDHPNQPKPSNPIPHDA